MRQSQLQTGDRVQYDSDWLRNTGQFTGPDAPCSLGPFAKGTVMGEYALNDERRVVDVLWDDGQRFRALDRNLTRTNEDAGGEL
jgi:hypothetical protein